jgi:hypothetical protein
MSGINGGGRPEARAALRGSHAHGVDRALQRTLAELGAAAGRPLAPIRQRARLIGLLGRSVRYMRRVRFGTGNAAPLPQVARWPANSPSIEVSPSRCSLRTPRGLSSKRPRSHPARHSAASETTPVAPSSRNRHHPDGPRPCVVEANRAGRCTHAAPLPAGPGGSWQPRSPRASCRRRSQRGWPRAPLAPATTWPRHRPIAPAHAQAPADCPRSGRRGTKSPCSATRPGSGDARGLLGQCRAHGALHRRQRHAPAAAAGPAPGAQPVLALLRTPAPASATAPPRLRARARSRSGSRW